MRFRIILFYLHWMATVGLFFGLMVVAMLFPVSLRGRIMSACASWVYVGMRYILGIDCEVIGQENIPETPCVILSKHQSAWETIAFNWIFFPPCFVLKKELISIPFFGWGLAMAGSIAIDRAAGAKSMIKVVEKGKERLAQGFNIVIFPEGTRMSPGQRRPFRRGGSILACEMKVPIIPVALNAGEFMPRGLKLLKTGTVKVSVGAAIDPTGKTAQQVNKEAEAWIEAEMRKITDPSAYQHEMPQTETDLAITEKNNVN